MFSKQIKLWLEGFSTWHPTKHFLDLKAGNHSQRMYKSREMNGIKLRDTATLSKFLNPQKVHFIFQCSENTPTLHIFTIHGILSHELSAVCLPKAFSRYLCQRSLLKIQFVHCFMGPLKSGIHLTEGRCPYLGYLHGFFHKKGLISIPSDFPGGIFPTFV